MFITVTPMGAVRQTRADAWKRRPVVLRYRAFKDAVRAQFGKIVDVPETLCVDFYLPLPESWSGKKKALMGGKRHRQKPDIDNLAKAVMDTLWPGGDEGLAELTARKYWAKGDAGFEIWIPKL